MFNIEPTNDFCIPARTIYSVIIPINNFFNNCIRIVWVIIAGSASESYFYNMTLSYFRKGDLFRLSNSLFY